ncbi:MAG TPA: hypothetical protein VHE12_05820 [bacterium]|nr:hypothetical protein [bacterium]
MPIKVRALKEGRYKRKRRVAGSVFTIDDESHFSGVGQKHKTKEGGHIVFDGWMEKVDDDTPEGDPFEEGSPDMAEPVDKGSGTATEAIDKANAKRDKKAAQKKAAENGGDAPTGPKPPKRKGAEA